MPDHSPFEPNTTELTGGFPLQIPPETAFPLFSPLGETSWVPGWNPELLYPAGVAWERGMIFRTPEERGEAIWVVTALDRSDHHVEYHRVEAGRYVARVRVDCAEQAGGTLVRVAYVFVGLSQSGNDDIAQMSQAAFAQKMERWRAWIDEHLRSNPCA